MLLKPRRVAILDCTSLPTSPEASPYVNALLALSDLKALFDHPPYSAQIDSDAVRDGRTLDHVGLKILFYAARLLDTPLDFMEGLVEEVDLRASRERPQNSDS